MNQLDASPSPYEMDAKVATAIAACDNLDGVTDGIIATPDLCKLVGKIASYPDGTTTINFDRAAKVPRQHGLHGLLVAASY